ncbi:LacI family DNA-binding transcriptional regulator [Rhizobium sp. BK176]|uniref:LacI family DNA-binding transcriptional regulator n=1 Tax=Rhizobium sp. BK176 TaxID=2587071 RepID=UPI00386931C2
MATVRDVANEAGVSVATVSHLTNQSWFVTPETKLRVPGGQSSISVTVAMSCTFASPIKNRNHRGHHLRHNQPLLC